MQLRSSKVDYTGNYRTCLMFDKVSERTVQLIRPPEPGLQSRSCSSYERILPNIS